MADDGPKIRDLKGFEIVGHGGFGVVYRAHQEHLNRDVAVKVLNVSGLAEASRRRFERERKTLGSVSNHPAIVTLYDSGITDDGLPYLVMELMTGGSLADRADAGIPSEEAIEVITRVSAGLQLAHEKGIIHRDIKPENILISEYGEPKLADFGIASLLEGTATMTTSITTTVEHAAPEILDGAEPSPKTDLYSLGSTLYTLLRGQSPHRQGSDESMMVIVKRVLTDTPPNLRDSGVDEALAAVIERAMARNPDERYDSVAEFVDALETAASATESPPMAESSQDASSVVEPVDASESVDTGATQAALDPESVTEQASDVGTQTGARRPKPLTLGIAVGVLVAAAIATVFALARGDDDQGVDAASQEQITAPVSDDPADILSGTWLGHDPMDGSTIWLFIELPSGDTRFHLTYYDESGGVCRDGAPAIIEDFNALLTSTVTFEFTGVSAVCIYGDSAESVADNIDGAFTYSPESDVIEYEFSGESFTRHAGSREDVIP